MTIEAVAARARVGKATIYRRYSDKAALVLEALSRSLPPRPEIPNLGDTREELVELVGYLEGIFGKRLALFAGMLIERDRQPAVLDQFRTNHVGPRRQVMCDLIKRGQERGDIRTGFSPNVVADTIVGSLLERYIIMDDPSSDMSEEIVASIWPMIATNP